MTWASRCLRRVFNIDIGTCTECGGPVKVIDLISCAPEPGQFSGDFLAKLGNAGHDATEEMRKVFYEVHDGYLEGGSELPILYDAATSILSLATIKTKAYEIRASSFINGSIMGAALPDLSH